MLVSGDLKLKERITVRKFNGDGPLDREVEPFETVIIEDGVVVEIIKNATI